MSAAATSWKLKKKFQDIFNQEKRSLQIRHGKTISVCLAYPNYYRIGMSNLGFQTVYSLINEHVNAFCERTFLPDPEDEKIFFERSIPLFSLESQRPLSDFHILAFSIPFENDYPNVLKILDLSRITLLTGERGEKEPFVIGGGVSLTLNPEPVADFFDLFLLGEGEEVITEFLDLFASCHSLGMSREEVLFTIQKHIRGAYVPQLYRIRYSPDCHIQEIHPSHSSLPQKIEKRWVQEINTFATEQCILSPHMEFKDLFLTEVSRGCRRSCRFCAAGFLYKPARFRTLEILTSSILKGIEENKKIGLMGTAVSDHPHIHSLCEYVLSHEGKVAIGSIRVDQIDEKLALLLAESGVESISLAPEAGTQRLRDIIRKDVTDEQIDRAIELILEHNIPNIRLYFMIGLPGETDDDIEGIARLTKRITHLSAKRSAGKKRFRRITLSINQFVPKPATPFQWHPLEDIGTVRKKLQKLNNILRKEQSVKIIHDLPKWNYIQALLSLGDRKVSTILLAVHKNNGNWLRAFKNVNVNPDFYVYRTKSFDETFPWDFIDHGMKKQYLLSEYKAAMGLN